MFPDWSDRVAFIVASGPSANAVDIERLRDSRIAVMAIKESIDLCPWADAVYGCDAHWWIYRKGLPKFKGLKLGYDRGIFSRFPDVVQVFIDTKRDRILPASELKIGNGGNSGFQALNLVVQFRAKRIGLIGFDMGASGKLHWYGRNNWPNCSNPVESNFDRWKRSYEASVADLNDMGVDVVNLSQHSIMTCFRKLTLDQTLEEWGCSAASGSDATEEKTLLSA